MTHYPSVASMQFRRFSRFHFSREAHGLQEQYLGTPEFLRHVPCLYGNYIFGEAKLWRQFARQPPRPRRRTHSQRIKPPRPQSAAKAEAHVEVQKA